MDSKPCPFCAYTKTRIESWQANTNDHHWEHAVTCENCGACGPSDLGKSGAIEMWNMRRTEFPNTTKGAETNPQS